MNFTQVGEVISLEHPHHTSPRVISRLRRTMLGWPCNDCPCRYVTHLLSQAPHTVRSQRHTAISGPITHQTQAHANKHSAGQVCTQMKLMHNQLTKHRRWCTSAAAATSTASGGRSKTKPADMNKRQLVQARYRSKFGGVGDATLINTFWQRFLSRVSCCPILR